MEGVSQRLMEQKFGLTETEVAGNDPDDGDNEESNTSDEVKFKFESPQQTQEKHLQWGEKDLFRALAAELLGVAVYVFIGCMATPHPAGVGPGKLHPRVTAVPIALAHGLTLVTLTAGLLKISGAHLNPAVSVGVALCGEMSPMVALLYVLVQVVGGVIGAAFCRAILPEKIYVGILGGAHLPAVSPGLGVVCETVLVCLLVLVYVLSVVEYRTKSARAPLAIGFTLIVGILASIGTTGGSMNPARSFGPALSVSAFNIAVWKDHYIFWAGAVFGAAAAAFTYRTLFSGANKRLFGRVFLGRPRKSSKQESNINTSG